MTVWPVSAINRRRLVSIGAGWEKCRRGHGGIDGRSWREPLLRASGDAENDFRPLEQMGRRLRCLLSGHLVEITSRTKGACGTSLGPSAASTVDRVLGNEPDFHHTQVGSSCVRPRR